MNAAIINILVGFLQPVIPVLVATAISNGWIDPASWAGIASIFASIGAVGHSAATTVVKK